MSTRVGLSNSTPYLKIEVNQTPVAFIELMKEEESLTGLNTLKVTLDIKHSVTMAFQTTASQIESIIGPSSNAMGYFWKQGNVLQVRGCESIKERLKTLDGDDQKVNRLYLERLLRQDLVHTMQIPLLALQSYGLLTKTQMVEIDAFIQQHL